MDFPLWDSLDDQGYLPYFDSEYHATDEVGQYGEYYDYRPSRDITEEDAINVKCCLQVLRILIHKADEEIAKLEEDVLMLQCRLAWHDDEWRTMCSAVLREKIDHLDALIKGLETDISEGIHRFSHQFKEPGNPAYNIHDLMKHVRQNYLKSKQQLAGEMLENQRVCISKIQNSSADKLDDSKLLFDYSTKCTGRDKKVEVKTQLPRVHETEVYVTIIAEPRSSLKPQDRETRQEFKSRNVQKSCMESPSMLNIERQHKCEVLDKISKNVKQQANQEPSATTIKGASETTSMWISSQQKRRLSLNPQTNRDRGFQSFQMNLRKTDCDTTNSTPYKATNLSGEDAPKDSSPCIKNVEKLTIKDLKTIARNRKLKGCMKLRKDELRKRLGL